MLGGGGECVCFVEQVVREGLIRDLNLVRGEDTGEEGKREVCYIPEAKGITCFQKEEITCCW